MKDKIKDIIDRATELRNGGMSDLDIARFVHIELGNILIYDNSYTENYNKESNEDLTNISRKRQEMLLGKKTDVSDKAQICKGMAEIYVAILNKVGINSKVIGVESKGDVDGDIRDDGTTVEVPESYDCSFDDNFEIITGKNEKSNNYTSQHYYGTFEIDGVEYIQDFLIDNALFRIKVGEASLNDNIPGLCIMEDYKARSRQSLPLADEYIKGVQADYEEYTNEPNVERTFQFLFEQLKSHNENFGFEESKDFFLLISKIILPRDFNPKEDLKIVNLLKENQSTCDIVSIYCYNGINYLLRGGDESTTVRNTLGEISTSQIKTLLSQGFEPRKKSERENSDMLNLKELLTERQSNISMKAVVSNAITSGVAIEDVQRIDNVEIRELQENLVEGVSKDD